MKRKTEQIKQFASTTLEDAKNRHRVGLLSAISLVHTYFETMLDFGWDRKFDQQEVCDELGVSKSTFYRTLSLCKIEGYLDFEAIGGVKVKNVNPYHRKACLKSDTTVSDLQESIAEIKMLETTVSNLTPESQIRNQNFTSDSKATLKPLHSNDSATPSYSSQITFNSSSSINQENQKNANPDDDDDDFKNSFLKAGPEKANQVIDVMAQEVIEKPVKASRHKRMIKALKTILMECDEDPIAWDGFFDWCEESLWPTFDEPVTNKIGWLKSIDPESELTRLEFNWDNYLGDIAQRNGTAPKKRVASQEWQKVLAMAARLEYRQRTDQVIKNDPLLLQTVTKIGGLGRIAQAEGLAEQNKLKAAFIETFNALA